MRGIGLPLGACLVIVVGCNRAEPVVKFTESTTPSDGIAATQPPIQPETGEPVGDGTVTETISTAGYTYVLVDTGEKKVWAAAPEFRVSVGDKVTVPAGMAMHNYHSQTLNRDFDVVYFVSSVRNHTAPSDGAAKGPEMPASNPHAAGGSTPANIDLSGIEKPEGGKKIEEIYAEKAELAKKKVTVRGKVVKFNAQIMNKNWLHLRDGSGNAGEGTHDLTVTTGSSAKVGDTVLVTGELHLDRDFGFGYKYGVIIEDADVKVE
ncbi:MAG: DNA-binding protein [Pirellulales bacterium]|nr:DNA-binding protein [Pirellulales bacterium]